jgi:hypothetical protein
LGASVSLGRSPEMSTTWIVAYFAVGAVVYLSIRTLYKKATIATSEHTGIWFGDLVGLILWPIPAAWSLVWLVGEWSAKREKKKFQIAEVARQREVAANPYRALSTDQLLQTVETARKSEGQEK